MTGQAFEGKTAEMPLLTLTPHGVYDFEFGGTGIHHPARSECGRFWISPEYYGFALWQTGGGCTAWRRDFVLEDGTPVYMLVTQDGSSQLDEGQPIEIGVYRDDGGWIAWIQDDGCIDDCPPHDVTCEGWPGDKDTPKATAADGQGSKGASAATAIAPEVGGSNEPGLLARFQAWAKAELGDEADPGSLAVAWMAFRGGAVSERNLWIGEFSNTVTMVGKEPVKIADILKHDGELFDKGVMKP